MYILFRRQYKIKYEYIYSEVSFEEYLQCIYINRVKYCKYSSNETLYIIYK